MAFLSLAADLALAVVVLLIALYVYFTSNFGYWKKKGVPCRKPIPFFGSFLKTNLGKTSLQEEVAEYYALFKSKGYGGVFQIKKPTLVVCEPEMIKQILTKDFSSLMDHGMPMDKEPLSGHLFNQTGDGWRNLRYKLAPVFTSGKLKLMFSLMKDCADELNSVIHKDIAKTDSIELKGLLHRFATDVIGTCAFGIQCNSLQDPTSHFHVMGKKIFTPNFLFILRFFLLSLHTKLAELLPFDWIFPGINDFFLNLSKGTVEYRKANGIQRNDFVNLLMEIKDKDDKAKAAGEVVEMELTDNLMAAQSFVFFLAGLDNVANTVCFCLYELALHPDLQTRLAEDVNAGVSKHGGELTYAALKEMTYLNQALDETLRKYPPGGVLMREVTAPEYMLPGTGVLLEKGTAVFISVAGMHRDPEFYPDPERFDPERFTEEAKSQRHPFTFLPFGEGPRFCIAQRFAMLEMKLAIAALVREFDFSPCDKTAIPMKFLVRAFAPTPKDGVWLKVKKRE